MSKGPKVRSEYIVHNNKVLRFVDNQLYSGWEAVEDLKVVTEEPKFKWKGSKIPYSVWSQVCGFMRWSQKTFKEEALVTFFYNTVTTEWAAWAFPQEPNGMTVRYLQNHPLYAQDRARFNGDWIQFGSLHHHCTAGAFASGTDKDDEKDRDGIHITLGKLDEKAMDVHCRQTFDGVVSPTKLLDWVETPDYLNAAPPYLISQFGEFALRAVMEAEFPDEWKERVMQRVNFPQGRGQLRLPAQGHTVLTSGLPPAAGATEFKGLSKSYDKACAKLNEWEQRMALRTEGVLTQLGISAEEAHKLLEKVPTTAWEDADVLMRTELVKALNREGVPHLYAEDLLKKMAHAA